MTNNIIGFFGELNPLSNFHLAPFNINGVNYHSSEQYIQHQKCIVFGDKELKNLILKAETALECKILSHDITNYDPERWKLTAKASCTPGILVKFEQNPTLWNLLKGTSKSTLVECCKDKDWGDRILLFDVNCLNSDQWHSQGLLGEILEAVHTVL